MSRTSPFVHLVEEIMHPAIEACQQLKRGLLIFPSYLALRNWLDDNAELLFQLNVIHNKSLNELTFSNGNKLFLNVVNLEEDFNKFRGARFNFVMGSSSRLFDSLIRP